MSDRHIRRSGDDYAEVMAADLPTGEAWPREPDSALMAVVDGLAQLWGDVDARAADLLEVESDPRFAYELLPDWEKAFGLPDPCVKVPLTLPERRVALTTKMTTQGGQSRAFFIALAAKLGYTITIREFVPFQFGLSSYGGSHGALFGPTARFYWRVTVPNPRYTRFQYGYSTAGRDPFLKIVRATDLECVMNRWKPAHTVLIFSYAGV